MTMAMAMATRATMAIVADGEVVAEAAVDTAEVLVGAEAAVAAAEAEAVMVEAVAGAAAAVAVVAMAVATLAMVAMEDTVATKEVMDTGAAVVAAVVTTVVAQQQPQRQLQLTLVRKCTYRCKTNNKCRLTQYSEIYLKSIANR